MKTLEMLECDRAELPLPLPFERDDSLPALAAAPRLPRRLDKLEAEPRPARPAIALKLFTFKLPNK